MKYTQENASEILSEAKQQYEKYLSMHLNLNMSRGKPAPDQLSLSSGLLDAIDSKTVFNVNGNDYTITDNKFVKK